MDSDFKMKLKALIEKGDSFEVENLLELELKKYPDDIDLLLKLCMTRIRIPIQDSDRAMECIEAISKIDPNNFYASILEYCIYDIILGMVDEKQFNRLKALKCSNDQQLAIIKYLIAHHYYFIKNNKDEAIELLKASVALCDEYVSPYYLLGNLYIQDGKETLGRELLRKAADNIQMIYPDEYIYDFTDVNEYMNEIVTGIYATPMYAQETLEVWKSY